MFSSTLVLIPFGINLVFLIDSIKLLSFLWARAEFVVVFDGGPLVQLVSGWVVRDVRDLAGERPLATDSSRLRSLLCNEEVIHDQVIFVINYNWLVEIAVLLAHLVTDDLLTALFVLSFGSF